MTSNPPDAAHQLHIVALKADIEQLEIENQKLREERDALAGEAAVLRYMLVYFPAARPDGPPPPFH